MEWVTLGVLVLLGVLSPVRGNPLPTDATNPFHYDWQHLRTAGLVVAAVLCVIGVIVLFSGKCKCRSKASRHRPPPDLSHRVPGAASSC
ncbi:FXYD domain-containing ion transport regulator 3-like isoform X1 [Heliangelus exortis]|uniref:FXYD domain-containing ion transport regulator 3-like isoform X1 n=1 Tax=Heliangelus exortis TaxID=472823 RepID=UPI003A8E30B7